MAQAGRPNAYDLSSSYKIYSCLCVNYKAKPSLIMVSVECLFKTLRRVAVFFGASILLSLCQVSADSFTPLGSTKAALVD